MTGGVDLHCHTTASDGVWTPRDAVERALRAELFALAITDHDSVEGVAAAARAGRELGMPVIPGVELAARWEGRAVHLLGLWLDPDGPMRAYLEGRREDRRTRAREMVCRLEAAGLGPLTIEGADDPGRALGRPHVAAALVRAGHAKDIDDAFRRHLTPGGVGYVPQETQAPEEMIARLRAAGAAVVWAHPALAGIPVESMPWLALLDGLEADHPRQTERDAERLRAIAGRHGLFVTGGSDSHGTEGRDRIGDRRTPQEVVRALKERAAGRPPDARDA